MTVIIAVACQDSTAVANDDYVTSIWTHLQAWLELASTIPSD